MGDINVFSVTSRSVSPSLSSIGLSECKILYSIFILLIGNVFNSGYCWCAQEDTGKPIPGTSVKDSNPKCDGIPLLSRPMKGCPEHKKHIFLKDLMDYLRQKHRFLLHTITTFCL